MSDARLPVVYVPHGGGPWPFVDLPMFEAGEVAALSEYFTTLPRRLAVRPRALLVVSAHWEERVPTVMSAARPPMLYDYYGFPREAYELTWPAPGDPGLAARVRELLQGAGFETAADPDRGFDHGTFVPLKVMYPAAEVPTVQLSLRRGLDPEEHLAMGRALLPLRDEEVLVVGSGMSFHNLPAFFTGTGRAVSETFDAWLREVAVAPTQTRSEGLRAWSAAPAARQAHPREEHLLPLMVVAGAAGDDRGEVGWSGFFGGARISAFHYG
jgi:aromatic ring-opening dioxygenase catalytic subunit (LigB family)